MTGGHYRGPYRNFGNPTHDVGWSNSRPRLRLLRTDQHVEGCPSLASGAMSPARPTMTKVLSEVRHDLQGGSKALPQRTHGTLRIQRPSSHSNANRDRILHLCDRPVLRAKAGDTNGSRGSMRGRSLVFRSPVNIILRFRPQHIGANSCWPSGSPGRSNRILQREQSRIPNRTAQVTIQDDPPAEAMFGLVLF